MNARSGLLGAFVILTLIFASLALVEHGQVTTSTATTTSVSTDTTTTTITATVGPLTSVTTVTTSLPPVTNTSTETRTLTTTLPPVTTTQTQTSTVTTTLPPTTTTQTMTTTQTITKTVFVGSANALQLQLALNTGGGRVNITVADFNTLSYTNNVTAADKWLIALSEQNVQPCWMDSWPVGLAIASGHYTSSNITTAKLLDLVNPGVTYSCSLSFTSGYPAGYLFQPSSVTASAYRCQLSFCPTEAVSTSVDVSGYWNQGGVFASFPSGTYTVFAEDEWGHSSLAYFTVS